MGVKKERVIISEGIGIKEIYNILIFRHAGLLEEIQFVEMMMGLLEKRANLPPSWRVRAVSPNE